MLYMLCYICYVKRCMLCYICYVKRCMLDYRSLTALTGVCWIPVRFSLDPSTNVKRCMIWWIPGAV